jgi:quercetin dioxygenase-like cupin family protein
MTSRGAGVLEETSNPYEANARLAWRNDRRTATDGFRLVMTESVPEAQLKKTDAGLIPQGEGWFVLNARDVSWIRSEERGQDTDFEGGREWTELGFRIQILGPGQHSLYHGENGQEDFLVVSGECVLVIEGEERRLKAWDFVHCPPWTKHAFVGGGDGPCVIVMAGIRAGGFEVVYAVDGVAAKHGASVPEETTKADEAYSGFGPEERTTYQEGWLPW